MRHEIFRKLAFGSMIALFALWYLDIASFDSADKLGMTVTRALGSAAFVFLIISYGTKVWKPTPSIGKAMLFALPAFVIAVNNFPWIPYISGEVTVTGGAKEIALLALECVFIGVFEEAAFRGIILDLVLLQYGKTKKGVFVSLVATSAAFGLIHAFNLLAGAGFGATLQQIGYSFLIGGMCGVVFVKTKCLPLAMLIHALYDFCGYLIPRLGEGKMWTAAEIVLTAVVAVVVCVFYVYEATRLEPYSDATEKTAE